MEGGSRLQILCKSLNQPIDRLNLLVHHFPNIKWPFYGSGTDRGRAHQPSEKAILWVYRGLPPSQTDPYVAFENGGYPQIIRCSINRPAGDPPYCGPPPLQIVPPPGGATSGIPPPPQALRSLQDLHPSAAIRPCCAAWCRRSSQRVPTGSENGRSDPAMMVSSGFDLQFLAIRSGEVIIHHQLCPQNKDLTIRIHPKWGYIDILIIELYGGCQTPCFGMECIRVCPSAGVSTNFQINPRNHGDFVGTPKDGSCFGQQNPAHTWPIAMAIIYA